MKEEKLLELVDRLDKYHRESSDFGDGFDAYAYIEWPRLRDAIRDMQDFIEVISVSVRKVDEDLASDLLVRLNNWEPEK